MNTNKLHSFLDSYFKDVDFPRSILIDGEWGSGKTYNVNKFLQTRKNTIYTSVYGMGSVEQLIIKLSEYLDSSHITNIRGNYFLNSSIQPMKANGVIVVIDDIERKAESFTFDTLFGIISNLRNLGFNVISIASIKSKNEKFDYSLLEKSVDLILGVDAGLASANEITKHLGIICNESILQKASQNLRYIERAANLYTKIDQYLCNQGKNDYLYRTKLDKYSFFEVVVISIKCCFSIKTNPPEIDDASLSKISYENDVEEFGENVANLIYSEFENNPYSWEKDLVRVIISIFQRNDYELMISKYWPTIDERRVSGLPPFCYEPFYMSDEGKRSYKEDFLRHIHEFDFQDKQDNRVLITFIRNFFDELTDSDKKIIIKRIVDTIPNEQSHDYLLSMFFDAENLSDELVKFKEEIEATFLQKKINDIHIEIENSLKEKQYNKSIDILHKCDKNNTEEKDNILLLLEENNYFFPDLEDEIDHDVWNYCHQVAKFVYNTSSQCKFVCYLKKIYANSKSKTLKQRCIYLVRGNIDRTFDFEK